MLSLSDLRPEQLSLLVERGAAVNGRGACARPLEGKMVGIYFTGASTRTRTPFTVAALRLGAATITYVSSDPQLSTGETIEDTARVLSG